MGLSLLTRYNLYTKSAEFIESGNDIIKYKDESAVKNMYYDSAILIYGFEDLYNKDSTQLPTGGYEQLFQKNANDVRNKLFVNRIIESMKKKLKKKKVKEELFKLSFKKFFHYLIKSIDEYQEEIISENFVVFTKIESIRSSRKQTFLSYTYANKGLTNSLFIYFWMNFGFLYVNWMWDGVNSNSSLTKEKLEQALADSKQFLFLRTIESELRVQGNHCSIRQWCAWEIGNFYTKKKEEKYYTSLYDREESRNDMLDTFKPFKEVIDGEIKY